MGLDDLCSIFHAMLMLKTITMYSKAFMKGKTFAFFVVLNPTANDLQHIVN